MKIREFLEPDGKPAGTKTEPPTDPVQKKYDDNEVNAILARNKEKYASEGVKSVLSALGFESADTLKDFVEKAKQKETEGLSNEEKIKKEFEEYKKAQENEKAEVSKKLTVAETKAAILALGVPADKADKVMKLSAGYEGETAEEKIKAVLEEFPEFVNKAPANAGIKTGTQTVDAEAQALEAFKKQFGYK